MHSYLPHTDIKNWAIFLVIQKYIDQELQSFYHIQKMVEIRNNYFSSVYTMERLENITDPRVMLNGEHKLWGSGLNNQGSNEQITQTKLWKITC